jgi:triacylglycerol lipase
MHGIGVTAHLLKPGSVFDTITHRLRENGLSVYAPRVAPYVPVEERARTWRDHCERILAQDGRDRLNLLGFSTGGLDARYLVSRLEGCRYVASVTTLATPHFGSSIASGILALPGPVRRALLATIQALARAVYPEARSDVEATLRELTPDHMERRYNRMVEDHESVTYCSLAAQAGTGAPNAVSPLLWLLNRYVFAHEGLHDGIVSVHSAQWTGYRGYVEADHGQLVGIADSLVRFDPVVYYLSLAAYLARNGF